MARVTYVVVRSEKDLPAVESRLQRLAGRLKMDHLPDTPAVIVRSGMCMGAVYQNSPAVNVHGASICLGLTENGEAWWEPGKALDGSFAIFRETETGVEIVTDALASRTVWTAQNDRFFIASTSQRAIVAFLESFVLNRQAMAWMLSSGTLGPGHSWDERIRHLPGDSTLRFDMERWQAEVETRPVRFTAAPIPASEQRQRLAAVVEAVLSKLHPDPRYWVLPLSGGVDSRALLLGMGLRENLPCITWGTKAALQQPKSDAVVARRLTEHFGIPFRYFPMEMDGTVHPDLVLRRFLQAGEGRVDHIRGYLDGFATWKTLVDEGITGIVRGDEAFGATAVPSTGYEARRAIACMMLMDYGNLPPCPPEERLQQTLPEWLQRRHRESLVTWRDRLFQQFRVPYELAALTDLKTAYVEVLNPLLAGSIQEVVREMPDHLRTGKKVFRELVKEQSPKVPFAAHPAVETDRNLLRSARMVELLRGILNHEAAFRVLPPTLHEFILAHLMIDRKKQKRNWRIMRLRRYLKRLTGPIITGLLQRGRPKVDMDPNRLALRGAIVVKMVEILEEDAAFFAETVVRESGD